MVAIVCTLLTLTQAAAAGDNTARTAAAGMWLKGEGAVNNSSNHTRAVELYEAAAAEGHVRALNGECYYILLLLL
jgi:TPR repeat protein